LQQTRNIRIKKEAEISRMIIDKKNVRTISNTNYFENIKNKCWGVVSHLGFSGSWDPPPLGEGPWDPRIPKWEKLEYCNTFKIKLYKFKK